MAGGRKREAGTVLGAGLHWSPTVNWQGELLHITIAPRASAPMEARSEARLSAGIGIEGDRYATGLGTDSHRHHIDRQATLIEVETLEALARDRPDDDSAIEAGACDPSSIDAAIRRANEAIPLEPAPE